MATIFDVRDALCALDGIDVYHFKAPEQRPNKFIIWAETEVNFTLEADDEPQAARPRGQIYYYTDAEYDSAVNDIIGSLIDYGIGFNITNVGWDDMLRLIVYQIDWEVDCGTGEIY